MGAPVTGVNPQMLVWARKRSGHSVDQVADALRKTVDVIKSWEAGSTAPTYPQLEDLAYRVYKRPIALFFFPEPPEEPDPEHAFRTLPDSELEHLASDTRYKVRQALALQESLRELNRGVNPVERKIFTDLQPGSALSAPAMAKQVRAYLGVDARTQTSEWTSADHALKSWRNAVEEAGGVYVFKNSFKQKDVSGFCLYDDEFPLIYLNNGTAKTRQIFTIFHELAHILTRTSGVTKRNDSYIAQLTGHPKRIEVFCNQFATEVLVPTEELRPLVLGPRPDDEQIGDIATKFKVSREVVLRRFLDLGLVSKAYYESKVAQWKADYDDRSAKEEGGGNYYLTQASYLGVRYLRLAFRRYYEGAISLDQLADYLNIRVSSVPGLEQLALSGPERG
jgi:Zn-dependent peptidase ImmA (M78 family)/transcriptional regulator with XRE-family HTH domain